MTPDQLSKCSAVARFFNLPQQENDSTWQKFYTLPDGGTLSFSDDRQGRGQRLSIRAWPQRDLDSFKPGYYNQDKPVTHITVSMDKSTERIAHDIKSRIMPGYKQLVADCQKNKTAAEERTAAEIDLLLCVSKPFGLPVRTAEHNRYDVQPVKVNRIGLELKAERRYDGELRLEIECTPDVARQVAELLSNLCPAQTP